jgi:hypothetical protein
MALVSTISFGVAGAGVVVGVLSLVLGHGHADQAAPAAAAWVSPWASPYGAGVAGTVHF